MKYLSISLKVIPSQLQEQKRKKIRRLRDACNKELKEATDLMKNIEKLEKKFVQNARISMQNQEGGERYFSAEFENNSFF